MRRPSTFHPVDNIKTPSTSAFPGPSTNVLFCQGRTDPNIDEHLTLLLSWTVIKASSPFLLPSTSLSASFLSTVNAFKMKNIFLSASLVLTFTSLCQVQAFSTVTSRANQLCTSRQCLQPFSTRLRSSEEKNEREIGFDRSTPDSVINLDAKALKPESKESDKAATNTINERLLSELEEATQKEKFGARSAAGRKLGLVDGYGRARKTDEEVEEAIARARDLNGVNPVIALTGSLFALGVAAGLWYATSQLGLYFLQNPVDTDVYFVIRVTSLVRNVAMGLVSLASGFFGVTGLGIFLLGVRVAYGVITGELDPTPIKQNKTDKSKMPNMWDLMTNKKPSRQGGRNDDDNPFGI